jgi:hypothetical protein
MIKIKNRNVKGIDFIGDIHGHYDALVKLLEKLGYQSDGNTFRHPDRLAFFVGDYIDRGPKIVETLELVKSMVENESAIAIMGNHEYNAVGFNIAHEAGGYKRPHIIKNYLQHHETLVQFKNEQKGYDEYIAWFKQLPVFYEHELFRVVHASWDQDAVNEIKQTLGGNQIGDAFWEDAADINGQLFKPLEVLLKGRELSLPHGQSFLDKDGHKRAEIRIKWWEDPREHSLHSLSVLPFDNLTKEKLPISTPAYSVYKPEEKPVFFGHYWLKDQPNLYRENICCLDYSIAKGGLLAAYQFSGEAKLDNIQFVAVN